jgi:hypothetical protein
VNNTFADNNGGEGSAIAVSGVDARHLIYNNVIIGSGGQTAFHCGNSSSTPSPVVNTSDVFTAQGLAYGGTCADQSGLRGNISADPLFARTAFGDVLGDYRLQMASPAIDAGDNAAPQIPAADLDGTARIGDGNQDGHAQVDLGAYEYSNQPPVARVGGDQTVAADAACRATVILDGSASSDGDGDRLTFTWTGPFGTVSGATASVSLPAGTHVITLTVRDGRGGSASDTLLVTVVDTTVPTIQSAAATPSVLSPVRRQFVAVTISASASDSCGGPVACRITSVAASDTVDGEDWIITGDLTLNLRAERSNKKIARIYTITIECTDAAGNRSTKAVTVTVPRN